MKLKISIVAILAIAIVTGFFAVYSPSPILAQNCGTVNCSDDAGCLCQYCGCGRPLGWCGRADICSCWNYGQANANDPNSTFSTDFNTVVGEKYCWQSPTQVLEHTIGASGTLTINGGTLTVSSGDTLLFGILVVTSGYLNVAGDAVARTN